MENTEKEKSKRTNQPKRNLIRTNDNEPWLLRIDYITEIIKFLLWVISVYGVGNLDLRNL